MVTIKVREHGSASGRRRGCATGRLERQRIRRPEEAVFAVPLRPLEREAVLRFEPQGMRRGGASAGARSAGSLDAAADPADDTDDVATASPPVSAVVGSRFAARRAGR